MKTAFVYYGPHKIHKSWADSVTKESYHYSWGIKIPVLKDFAALIRGFFLPKADIYLVETLACVPAVYFKKGKVVMINDDIVFYLLQEKKGLYQKAMRFLLKRVDAIISSTKLVNNYAKKFTKVPTKIVYPFVDTKKFTKKADWKSKNVCFAGWVEKQKMSFLIHL